MEERKSALKWNVFHLKGEMAAKLKEIWVSQPANATFFHKFQHITKYYKQYSKKKTKEYKREELDARANLEIATAQLYEDIYNEEKQGEANKYKRKIEEIETMKARGVTIMSKVK